MKNLDYYFRRMPALRPVIAHLVLLGFLAMPATGQIASDVAVARLLIDVEGVEADFPDKAKGLLPLYIDIREAYRLSDEAVRALRDPDTSPVKLALDSVYSIVAEGLTREIGLRISPLDALRGQVRYLFGYPVGNVEKVARSGQFAGALEIQIDVTVPDANQSSWAVFSTGKVRAKGRPEMELRIRYVDATGGGWKEKVRVRSQSRVTVDEYWVLGIRRKSAMTAEDSLLPDLTRMAVQDLLERLRTRRLI